jgi:hypothetical protein
MRRRVVILLIAVVASGCGALSPAPTGSPTESRTTPPRAQPAPAVPSPVAQAQATHEYPGPAAPKQRATGSSAPARAVAAFADAYINWNARTVAAQMQALAEQSVGQARSAMELAAAQTASDYELQRGGIANSGTVEAVAALAGRGGRYVVVTRERTTATATNAYQGLQPAWHVAVATVTEVAPGQWAVSGWQPET